MKSILQERAISRNIPLDHVGARYHAHFLSPRERHFARCLAVGSLSGMSKMKAARMAGYRSKAAPCRLLRKPHLLKYLNSLFEEVEYGPPKRIDDSPEEVLAIERPGPHPTPWIPPIMTDLDIAVFRLEHRDHPDPKSLSVWHLP